MSFTFNVGDKVRVVEVGNKLYGKEIVITQNIGNSPLFKNYLCEVYKNNLVQFYGWKLEKIKDN